VQCEIDSQRSMTFASRRCLPRSFTLGDGGVMVVPHAFKVRRISSKAEH
jgi:hypothetical protein